MPGDYYDEMIGISPDQNVGWWPVPFTDVPFYVSARRRNAER